MTTASSSAERLTILTGASRGLGRAMAQRLLQSGGTLLCISRHRDDALAREAQAAGVDLVQWEQDLAEPAAASARLVEWLAAIEPARFARATLINNAGTVGQPRPLAEGVASELAQALRVGLEAPMLLTGAFLGATRTWPGRKEVLNISSGLGRNAMGSQAPYCAAKAGMDHFSRAVALEQDALPNGAKIVSLAPGVIDTDMQVQLRGTPAEAFPDRERFVQLKAKGMLDSPDVAAAKVLGYLDRADFGGTVVADVRDA
ncbi:MAG: SDR family NAD(P)-dependent oxidoreductase [Variovorax sp.]